MATLATSSILSPVASTWTGDTSISRPSSRRAYHELPPEERGKAAILGNNYGEAGAIDLLGGAYGLPKAIGRHQSYWRWGPRDYTGEVVIVLGGRREDLERRCREVDVRADLHPEYARPSERWTVIVCRGLHPSLPELWPQVKNWS